MEVDPSTQTTEQNNNNNNNDAANENNQSANSDPSKWSKTQESYMTKGDKSYYYWHPKTSKTVPLPTPQLLSKEVKDLNEEETFQKIATYSWLDDDEVVKVYIDLTKVGTPDTPEVSADQITTSFEAKGADLILRKYKGNSYRLKLANLKEEIIAAESLHKCIKHQKIILTLKKKDPKTKWWELLEKK